MNRINSANYQDGLFISRKEVRKIQKIYSIYLKAEIMHKINEIANLNQSIFENIDLANFLCDLDSFREIIKYNIFYTLLRIIKKINLNNDKDYFILKRKYNVVTIEYIAYKEKTQKKQSYVIYEMQMSNKIIIYLRDLELTEEIYELKEEDFNIAITIKRICKAIIEELKIEDKKISNNCINNSKCCIVYKGVIKKI